MCLVDQHAAHSRVVFERLLQQKNGRSIAIQNLLIPYHFTLTPIESSELLEHLDTINQQGISVYQTGPQAFCVDAIPNCLGNIDPQSLITKMLQGIHDFQDSSALKKQQDHYIAMIAARASISQRARLNMEEAQGLVTQLMQCEMPYQCPQGNPTLMQISQEELRKKFTK